MKILYDLKTSQPVLTTKFHGGSEYCKIIFYDLVKKVNNEIVEVFFDKNREIDSELLKVCFENNIRIHYISTFEDIEMLINEGMYDVFYSSLPHEYFNLKINKDTKFIYTVHGLRDMEMPTDKYEMKYCTKSIQVVKALYKKIWKRKYIELCRRKFDSIFDITNNQSIITSSYHSKYAIINNFNNIDEKKIKVLYCPEKKRAITAINDMEVLKKFSVKEKGYLLLVSADRWIKNNYRAIIAIDNLLSKEYKQMKDIKVLVLGVANKNVYKKIANKDKFIFKGYVNEDELEILYKNAHCFVYPTLNEGFGYPPIECMSYKTLVVASSISSVSEVCGDGVLYFNPYDISEIENRILQTFDKDIKYIYEDRMNKQYNYLSKIQKKMLSEITDLILNKN